jgi:ATP-dependent Lhr-like helicase
VYPVLKAMEETGRVRRGYFVAGLGGAQFAVPGAEERLRTFREPSPEPATLVLAATDPANPYGATLPWPRMDGEGRAQRAAGAQVVLHDGALVGWLGRGEQNLQTFLPDEEPERSHSARALAHALAGLVEEGRRKALLIARVDGEEVGASPLAPALKEAGFTPGIRGYLKRAPLGREQPASEPAEAWDEEDA